MCFQKIKKIESTFGFWSEVPKNIKRTSRKYQVQMSQNFDCRDKNQGRKLELIM